MASNCWLYETVVNLSSVNNFFAFHGTSKRIEGFAPFFNKNTKEIGNNNQNNNSRGKQQPVTYDAHTNIDL